MSNSAEQAIPARPSEGSAPKSAWQHWRPWLTAVFFLAILGVIGYAARTIDWHQVFSALRHIPPSRLLLAMAFSTLSYIGYSCVDLFALGYMEDRVSRPRAMAIAYVSYAFNQSFGALLGTIGFRLRLYSRHGLGAGAIAHIVGLSFLTNWSGYMLLGGIAFSWHALDLPPNWKIGSVGLHVIGAFMSALVLGYVLACVFSTRRSWTVFGSSIDLPHWRTALAQIALSTFIWLAIAATVFTFLRGGADPLQVLTVFLLASIAGLITHVPGGLGVIEAVFLALLGSRYRAHDLLAALIAYRAVYYIWPLLPALLLYGWLEAKPPSQPATEQPQ